MTDVEYVLPMPEAVSMTYAAADKLIAAGSSDAALMYVYILRHNGRYSRSQACRALGKDFPIDGAMAELGRMGLVASGAAAIPAADAGGEKEQPKEPEVGESVVARRDAPPEYSVSDIRQRVKDGSNFGVLVSEVQQRLGRVMSGGDLVILFGIYDYLGIPCEVILVLISYCIEEQERRCGEGRKPTLRMIEKEAYFWARNGIFSLDAAEKYIKQRDERRSDSYRIKDILGIKNRSLSPTEEKYIMSWLDMGFSAEAIEEAYDRTIVNKKELIWPYMNRIMESWHKKGLYEPEEIREGDGKTRPAEVRADAVPTDEEYERMKKYLDKLGGGNDGT